MSGNAKPTIFVTRRWPAVAEAELSKYFTPTFNREDAPLTTQQIAEGFADHDALAPTVSDAITAEIIMAGVAGKRKLIANFGVGVNHIDIEACKAASIPVSNTPGVLTDATADITMTLMLMLARRAGEGERELRSGNWAGWHPTHLLGRQLSGKTLGIIGMGRIGKAVARRCALGFGMKVVFFNRSKVVNCDDIDAIQLGSVVDVCAAADFISLHCAASPDTFEIINIAAFDAMRSDAVVINTARGEVIDETALIDALNKGSIGGAGLDVYQGEPDISAGLLTAPNTVLLPHLGSATLETRTAMGLKVIENLRAFFASQPLLDPIG